MSLKPYLFFIFVLFGLQVNAQTDKIFGLEVSAFDAYDIPLSNFMQFDSKLLQALESVYGQKITKIERNESLGWCGESSVRDIYIHSDYWDIDYGRNYLVSDVTLYEDNGYCEKLKLTLQDGSKIEDYLRVGSLFIVHPQTKKLLLARLMVEIADQQNLEKLSSVFMYDAITDSYYIQPQAPAEAITCTTQKGGVVWPTPGYGIRAALAGTPGSYFVNETESEQFPFADANCQLVGSNKIVCSNPLYFREYTFNGIIPSKPDSVRVVKRIYDVNGVEDLKNTVEQNFNCL